MNHVKWTMKSSIKDLVKLRIVANWWVVKLGHVKLGEIRFLEVLGEWRAE